VLTRWDRPAGSGPGLDVTSSAEEVARAESVAAPTTLAETERRLLLEALNTNRWNVSKAARQLGVSRDTLRYRIQKFGLTFP
jgi:transcriptional regulator of acetoin/glycerol metabolism